MKLEQIFITNEIGCRFHDGLNIILGVNHKSSEEVEGNLLNAAEQEKNDAPTIEVDADQQAESTTEPRASEEILENVSDTNGVGKTLLVSIVKHILGGDTETALVAPFFTEKKHWGFHGIKKRWWWHAHCGDRWQAIFILSEMGCLMNFKRT